MTRIALGITYTGMHYHGWQSQSMPHLATVQGALENALNQVAPQIPPINIICAGRTDAGVHALGQVVHFDTTIARTIRAWVLGTNTYLPADIAVKWAVEISDDFHARYSAVARHYRYLIYHEKTRSAIFHQHATHYYGNLDPDAMHTAAQDLIGEHDFNAFRAAQCQSKSSKREIQSIQVQHNSPYIIIDICANAFLHHMVRNIVGVLLAIGSGKRPIDSMKAILASCDRTQADVTAPAQGLYLTHVIYPNHFNLPNGIDEFPF